MNFIFRKAYFCPSNATPSVLFITSLPIVKIILRPSLFCPFLGSPMSSSTKMEWGKGEGGARKLWGLTKASSALHRD